MTELLDDAVTAVRALAPDVQDDLARLLLQLAGQDQPVYELTPEDWADLEEADDEIERGEFATDEEVDALWTKPITATVWGRIVAL